MLSTPVESHTCRAGDPDPLATLGRLRKRTPTRAADSDIPFESGWIGSLSYDLGRVIEPTAQRSPRARTADQPTHLATFPLAEWQRCDGAYVHDGATGTWYTVGDTSALPCIDSFTEPAPRRRAALGPFRSATGRARFEDQVRRVIEFIRAGDVFQVNLAHRLIARFSGDARALFARLGRIAAPWYGAYVETPGRAILSLSPELFLDFDATTRTVITRPMKGTRAASADPAELLASEKDAAELHMIIDLMRNDLGRVCDYRTVRVDQERAVEVHGRLNSPSRGVLQTVATVSGRLRNGLDITDLLGATFPPGSVTGAPKVRAMQIIDELEPVRRGPYCGAVGFISDSGRAQFNVAIRTGVIEFDGRDRGESPCSGRGTFSYSVGAGIVADSDPATEWHETLIKAGVLLGKRTRRWNGRPDRLAPSAKHPLASHA